MKVDLEQILALAGDLAEEDARDRFRRFLIGSARDSGPVRELLASALNVSDAQHRLALDDLVWSLGTHLGFEPRIPFAGRWASPSGVVFLLEVIVEEEPLDVPALIGRAEEEEEEVGLSALCLLVVGDPEMLRVEEAIIDGDEEGRLRAISISALLALSKIVEEYHLTHDDILMLLLTSGPSVDPIVDLIARVISQCEAETPTLEEIAQILGPLGRGGEPTPEGALQDLIDQSQYYAFGNRGSGRR